MRRWMVWRRWNPNWTGDWQVGTPPVDHGVEAVRVVALKDLAEQVKAELHSEDVDRDNSLAGPLGEVIANVSGSYSLEFITPEQLAEGIVAWLVSE